VIISQSGLNTSLGIYHWLCNVAVGSLVISVAGLLPGYYATFFLIDHWGRKPIQFLGFSMLTILLAVLGKMIVHLKRFAKFIEVHRIAGIYPGNNPAPNLHHKVEAFVALYCVANFFVNFGPNVTTFIVPGELFPTRYRSTAHGISAASGKLGAIVSQIIFFEVKETNTLQTNTL
jgi:MFS transporter, PHS family, inorganic phosphate transporter